MARRSRAKCSPLVVAPAPVLVISWTDGSGLSGVTSVPIGDASDTVRPSRTSPTAATTVASVMWFNAPRRSSLPHGTRSRNHAWSAVNSSALIVAVPIRRRRLPRVLGPSGSRYPRASVTRGRIALVGPRRRARPALGVERGRPSASGAVGPRRRRGRPSAMSAAARRAMSAFALGDGRRQRRDGLDLDQLVRVAEHGHPEQRARRIVFAERVAHHAPYGRERRAVRGGNEHRGLDHIGERRTGG